MQKPNTKPASFIILGLIAGCVPLFAQAVPEGTQTWVGSDGEFERAENWDPAQSPAKTSHVVFVPDTELTVTLAGQGEVTSLEVEGLAAGDDNPTLNLDLGGNVLLIGTEDLESKEKRGIQLQSISNIGTGRRTLILSNGEVIAGRLSLPRNADIEFSSLVVGSGATLRSPGNVGNIGRGELIVRDGGQWMSEGVTHYIGRVEDSLTDGIVRVIGKDSLWQASGVPNVPNSQPVVGIAAAGTGLLEVLDGGKMEAFILQLAGHQKHMNTAGGVGRGHVLVSGTGSSIECAHLFVGGGVERATDMNDAPGGVGLVELQTGGKLSCGRLKVFPSSTLSFRGGSLSQTGVYKGTDLIGDTVIEPGAILHYILESPASEAPLKGTAFTISGAVLDIEVSPDFNAPMGTEFPLISADGPIEGTFEGLENGATLTVGKFEFTIDYGHQQTGPVSLKLARRL